MMVKYSLYSFYIIALIMVFGCSSSDNGNEVIDDDTPPVAVDPPTSAALSAPANDEVCITGIAINDTQKEVQFSWNASENTDGYDIVVENLNTNQATTYNATATNTTLTLLSGEPFSWYVVSKSSETIETAQSSTWKFYLEGDGIVNYAPFPATIIAPESGSTLTGAAIELLWDGQDIDDDIIAYEIYFDDVDGSTLLDTTDQEKLEAVMVQSGKTYFWKVVTKDSAENSSESPVLTFKVD